MKIDANSPAVNLNLTSAVTKKDSTGAVATQGMTEDRATFRTDSQSVQSLTKQAMQSPEIRGDQVDALRQAVRSGTYKPDVQKTAQAIASSQG